MANLILCYHEQDETIAEQIDESKAAEAVT